jgi:hypothetical protein
MGRGDIMGKIQARKAEPDAMQCQALLKDLRQQYYEFIKSNRDFAANLDEFEKCLMRGNPVPCRAALGRLLLRLEEIAEDHQRLYDESPAAPKKEDVPESTRDFEIKKAFEKMTALLP